MTEVHELKLSVKSVIYERNCFLLWRYKGDREGEL